MDKASRYTAYMDQPDLPDNEPNIPHPLKNSDSPHYQMVHGIDAIDHLEQMFSKDDMAIWAKITAMKYRLRIGNKDAPSKEITKLLSYEEYYKYLME